MNRDILLSLSALLLTCCINYNDNNKGTISVIGNTPDSDSCYAKGVSAASCGIIDDKLIIIGGANFPYVPVSEGGKKRIYDFIYSTDIGETTGSNSLKWVQSGAMPSPNAYSVTCNDAHSIYTIGGIGNSGSLTDVYQISITDNEVRCDSVMSMPFTLDNSSGTIIGRNIYIAGGNKDGKPTDGLFQLNLDEGTIRTCSTIPGGPRVQPVCVSSEQKIYIWGGFYQMVDSHGNTVIDSCTVHTDGWCYDISEEKWSQLPAPHAEDGTELTLSGAVMTDLDDRYLMAVGGVNKDIFLNAIRGLYPTPQYHLHDAEWYRFNPYVLLFDTQKNEWEIAAKSSLAARAGASLVKVDDSVFLIGGETKPGIRSTDISRIDIKPTMR